MEKKKRQVKKVPNLAYGRIGQLWGIQIQKEVKSNPKQPAVKKCAALKKAMVKKDVKSKVVAKKWL